MEATPTFALTNQFLVWVVKKVLAKCDLDEEKLESRLKIRETHLNEDKSTEFTVLNTPNLPVLSDFASANLKVRSSCINGILHRAFKTTVDVDHLGLFCTKELGVGGQLKSHVHNPGPGFRSIARK